MPTFSDKRANTITKLTHTSSIQGWCIKESQQEKGLQIDLCVEEISLLNHYHQKRSIEVMPKKTLQTSIINSDKQHENIVCRKWSRFCDLDNFVMSENNENIIKTAICTCIWEQNVAVSLLCGDYLSIGTSVSTFLCTLKAWAWRIKCNCSLST